MRAFRWIARLFRRHERPVLGLIAALLVLGVVTLLALRQLDGFFRTTQQVERGHRAIAAIERLAGALAEAGVASRAFARSGREDDLAPYFTSVARVPALVEEADRLLDRSDHERSGTLRSLARSRLAQAAELIDARRRGGLDAAAALLATGSHQLLGERTDLFLAEVEQAERLALARSEQRVTDAARRLAAIVVLGSFVTASLVLASAFRSRRELRARWRSEQAQAESLALLNAVIDGTPDLVFVKDAAGRYRMVNDAASRALGVSRECAAGRLPSELLPAATARRIEEVSGGILQSGTPATYEYTLGAEGAERVFRATAAPYRDRNGQVLGIVGIAHDVTPLRRAELAQSELNARLQSSLVAIERRSDEMTLVSQLSSVLQACASSAEAHAILERYLARLFPGLAGAVLITDASRDRVDVVASWGPASPAREAFSPSACWGLRRGQIHEHPRGGPRCDHIAGEDPVYAFCIPMLARGEAIGVLHLSRTGSVTDDAERETRRDLAINVAEIVSVALGNLTLRESLRSQSIRDPLSGLFNRRFMEEALQRELVRAQRTKGPVGLIMLDLDHFKRFNDAFGHDAGDEVIRSLGQFLQRRVRADDIVCRFGGEEFVVIMPESDARRTLERAESLRREARALEIEYGGRAVGRIGLSLGIAVHPEHGATPEELLRAADTALYAAKRGGRDRAVLAPAASYTVEDLQSLAEIREER